MLAASNDLLIFDLLGAAFFDLSNGGQFRLEETKGGTKNEAEEAC